jgi:hypothetical protein
MLPYCADFQITICISIAHVILARQVIRLICLLLLHVLNTLIDNQSTNGPPNMIRKLNRLYRRLTNVCTQNATLSKSGTALFIVVGDLISYKGHL